MRYAKLVSVVVLSVLAGLVIKSGRGSGQDQATQTPTIIKQVFLENQTTSPNVALFTPTSSGLYRVTVYANVTPPSNSGIVCPEVSWTDESGSQSQEFLLAGGDFTACASSGIAGGGVLIVHAIANQPVTFNPGHNSGSSGQYNLLITVEQL